MKYIINTYEENVHEVVQFIVEANDKNEIIVELSKLSKPYNDALLERNEMFKKYGLKHKKTEESQNNLLKIGSSKVRYKGRDFYIYCFSDMNEYNIIPLDEWIQKHLLK